MLLLVFSFVIFFWLAVGAVQYVLCAAIRPLRPYALSAALWWACWGPCLIALLSLAGSAIIALIFFKKDGDLSTWQVPHPVYLGWGYFILGLICTVFISTGIAWLHQALVRRFTFALFRLYATAVSGGIGSVFGWCLSWWLLAADVRAGWIWGLVCMLALVFGFGTFAYRNARSLRGEAPTELAWVTQQEFDGV